LKMSNFDNRGLEFSAVFSAEFRKTFKAKLVNFDRNKLRIGLKETLLCKTLVTIEATTRQISLKIQRLIHGLRSLKSTV